MISPAQRSALSVSLARASPAVIESAFAAIKPQLQNDVWLAQSNRYRKKAVLKIKNVGVGAEKHPSLIKYISASAPLHVADASRYLGRALYCLSINDVHSARHFAYYAELRAAMSLLACAGIGVFNDAHFVVIGRRQLIRIRERGLGTHAFVWLAMEDWAKSLHAARVVGSGIRPANQSLATFVSAAKTGYSISKSLPSWLAILGLDLQTLSEDVLRRNESTYRPTDLVPILGRTTKEIRSFLSAMWTTFEPTALNRFSVIDEQLCRLILENLLGKEQRGLSLRSVRQIFGAIGIPPASNPRLQAVLRRKGNQTRDSEIFRLSKVPPRHEDPRLHCSMICRGALLIRLALAAVTGLIGTSGLSPADVLFLVYTYGRRGGVWSLMPSEIIDLWSDVDQALESVTRLGPSADLYSWLASASREVVILGEFERVAGWGIAD